MAWAILKGMGAPSLVSRVQVDLATGKATTEACKVESLKTANNTVSFDRQDEALPMPIDEKAGPSLKLAPILEDLDRYELQITGLPAGTYEVSIDGEPAAKVASEELAKGWNLARQAGPITKQADRVLGLVFQKNNQYYTRWRNVQLYVFPEWARGSDLETRRATEMARLDQQISEAEAEIDSARKTKSHHFEIKPQNP